MTPPPRVTIVIVTWNKKADVLALLDALATMEYQNVRVVVVDNASTDGTVQAIRSHPLQVTLLENRENLGGTGGFNTGLRHLLHHGRQEYIWLLDNDAMITPTTLTHLVAAMEHDPDIGVAGSRIMAPEKPDLMVELGGFVDWNHAIWLPHLRYRPAAETKPGSIVTVDYVAACSALVRESALRQVGIMDERFFLHWDDIDFCLRFREQGFRVAAVSDSVIFHSVEKGFNPNIVYFDIRNGLLMAAKHLPPAKRLAPQWALSRLIGMGVTAAALEGQRRLGKTLLLALKDALAGRYGGFNPPRPDPPRPWSKASLPGNPSKILLIANGPFLQVRTARDTIHRRWPGCRVDLMVQRERVRLFEELFPEGTIHTYDLRRDSLGEKARMALKLATSGYDLGVEISRDFLFPYTAFLKRSVLLGQDGELCRLPPRWLSMAKLPLLMAGGLLLAALLFPLTILPGFIHEERP